MDEIEIVAELRNLRRVVHATARGTSRKMQRVAWLNENEYEFGKERVRLEHLQPEFGSLNCAITDTIKKVKAGHAKGEDARELYYRLVEDVECTQATLDDIRVPKLPSVWAAERRDGH